MVHGLCKTSPPVAGRDIEDSPRRWKRRGAVSTTFRVRLYLTLTLYFFGETLKDQEGLSLPYFNCPSSSEGIYYENP